jgi:hypothetical protein
MGFLSNLLPAVIGGVAEVATDGAATPWVAGLMGAYKYEKTGSLMQGLMAGASAYGGGQLAGGISGLGTSQEALGNALNSANVDATPAQWNAMSAEQRAAALPGTITQNTGMDPYETVNPAVNRFSQGYTDYMANPTASNWDTFKTGISSAVNSPSALASQMGGMGSLAKYAGMAAAPAITGALQSNTATPTTQSQNQVVPYYKYSPGQIQNPQVGQLGSPVNYFNPSYTSYSTPQQWAKGGSVGMATGGISDLGGYSDGGRLLKGPGDGVSDSIPATIADKQPARLADGEFVVPARIVSELGNGSTEAGARQLYAMMDRVQSARKKTVGKNAVAKRSNPSKMLPA